jgi:hypothetical protein
MAEDVAYPQFVRAWLHNIASWVVEFIEFAREERVDPDELADWREKGNRHADHPNLGALLHNSRLSQAMELLTPLHWIYDEEEPPSAFRVLRSELSAIFTRWGCSDAIDEELGETAFFIDPSEPAHTLTAEEEGRLSRALRSLEWFLFCLPVPKVLIQESTEAKPAVTDRDGQIESLLSPVFFKTRRFLDSEGIEQLGGVLDDLKASPAAFEVYKTHVFRKSFRIGQEGQHPEKQRLFDILARAKAFLHAVEACLPIEGDEDRGECPFGTDWRDGEYYVCEAASALCDVLDGEEGEFGDSSMAYAHGWNAEINFGLRCLDSQLDTLLSQWGVADWEQRLAQGGVKPERPATIRPEQFAGLRRTVETIESGIAHAGLGTTADVAKSEAVTKRRKDEAGKRWKIIEVYHNHKDWSYAQIASAAGADRGHVCRIIKPLRDRERGQFKSGMPRGSKDKDGAFDAWQA